MRIIFSLLCTVILLSYPVAAGANPFELGADMVKDGLMAFLKAMGDSSYSAVGVNGSQSSMDAYISLSTFTFDPFSFKKVKDLNWICGVLAFLIMMLYLGAGAAWAILCRTWPDLAMSISEITDLDRDIAGKVYIRNIALGVFGLLLGEVVIRLILEANYVLSSLILKYTVISTTDVSSNPILYLLSGFAFLANIFFYAWRLIVIIGAASFRYVVGALLIWGATQRLAFSLIKYFFMVVFLQLIVIILITVGMISLDVVNSFNLSVLPFMVGIPGFIAILVMIATFVVSFMICTGIGMSTIKKTVVKVVTL